MNNNHNSSSMQYNECKICGANDGRAGLLIANESKGLVPACLNCHETRTSGKIVIHSNLRRTDEEIAKTFALIPNYVCPNCKIDYHNNLDYMLHSTTGNCYSS